ncbi:hypothetical protein [Falsiroseomonas sp.]|uniref:hypothetical protein n=1 Tax=Falsiroseomonas sp. TaxID=2870721 RepID=UPI0035679441
MNDEATPSARARVLECEEAIGVIAERLAEAETELAGMGLRDAKRHALRRRIAEMKADLDDAHAQKAKLAPAVQAERDAKMHAAKVARWQEACAALPGYLDEAAALDVATARLLGRMLALVKRGEAIAARSGLTILPHHLVQPVPTLQRLADILAAKIVLARGGGIEELPDDFQCELLPARAAQAATASGEAKRLAETILASSPDALHADRQRIAMLNAERMRHEEEEARQPRKKLPAPPPMVHTVAPVIGR